MVKDHSGNGFHAQARSDDGNMAELPSFNGSIINFDSTKSQYLAIDAALGSALQQVQSFTVTARVKLTFVPGHWPRFFEFGVMGESID
jgi:hypothetical protein